MTLGKKLAVVVLLIAAAGTATIVLREQKPGGGIRIFSSQSWYAVHVNDGQTYFGHLLSVSDETLTLEDAHYFEVYESAQPQGGATAATSTNFQIQPVVPQKVYNLIRRGSDDTFTSDHTMFIERRAVLFWEKLDQNSSTVKNIEASKKAR
ncbi:hypothetical protein HY250_04870 [Candidatus Azambacteria bacterium]|nr:hypothetical protein [Candidatus Azambacteria bacterium]MBI3685711.1 hypothetical protein [Candidatus Azambacteria bacterium]